jgi:uncharacterized protein YdaU (DUF1376 family)
MHYYQWNIGDYASHTQRLSLLEDLAYRRLLDDYYLHERPLNTGVASVARQIGMKEHVAEVQFILECFFQLCEDGWINKRADMEIAHYRSKIEQASKAGKASAERRSNERLTVVQPTNNQEPITNNKVKTATGVAPPDGVSQEVWQEFIKHRKAKKATFTPLVIKGIEKQAQKAGWSLEDALKEVVIRNWQSFNADWVTGKNAPLGQTTLPAYS